MASRHAPVRHTCPNIDAIIKWLSQARASLQNISDQMEDIRINFSDEESAKYGDTFYSIIETISEAKNYIDIDRELEELRDSNSALRDWGHELVKELEEELYHHAQTGGLGA